MRILLNGDGRDVGQSITIAELVAAELPSDAGQGIAVAVDSEVIPRSAWQDVRLEEGQRVELLAAIQGG